MNEELSADVLEQAVEDRLAGFNDEQMMFTYQIDDFRKIDEQARARLSIVTHRTSNRRYRVSDAPVEVMGGAENTVVCVGCSAAEQWAQHTKQLLSRVDVWIVTARNLSCCRCDVISCSRDQNENIVKVLRGGKPSDLIVWDGTLSLINMDNVFAVDSEIGMAITADDIAGVEYSKRQKRKPQHQIIICPVEN